MKSSLLALAFLAACAPRVPPQPPDVAPPQAPEERELPLAEGQEEDPNTDLIRDGIRSISRSVKACYDAALRKDTTLEGRLVFRLTLQPDGTVSEVETLEDSMGSPEVDQCAGEVLLSMQTEPLHLDAPHDIELPFTFSPR